MSTFGRNGTDRALGLFTAAMRAELERNDHKPDWNEASLPAVLEDLLYHCAKLTAAVTFRDWVAVREYTADVANMAMIVGDVAGVLEMPQADEPVLIGNVVFDVATPREEGGRSEGASELTEGLGDAGREFLTRVSHLIRDVNGPEWVEATAGKIGPL